MVRLGISRKNPTPKGVGRQGYPAWLKHNRRATCINVMAIGVNKHPITGTRGSIFQHTAFFSMSMDTIWRCSLAPSTALALLECASKRH